MKQEIEKGFAIVDERTHIAIVRANVTSWPDTDGGILHLMKRFMGLRAELTLRHGYHVIVCVPSW